MTYLVTFQEYIDSLPQQQAPDPSTWRRTRAQPCPLLSRCNTCNEYLPMTSFYARKQRKNGRRDITGGIKNSRCIYCHRKEYFKLTNEMKLFYLAKRRAKEKGLDFSLAVEDIIIPEYCPVLGIKLKPGIGIGAVGASKKACSPTIDRIDNSKGYTKENIKVISYRANLLKRDATLEEMRSIADYMEREAIASSGLENFNTRRAD